MPELYIITGSNGAGKSTIGPSYLPKHIQHSLSVFDGDKLFMNKKKELYPFPAKTHKEAKRLAYEWLTQYFDSLVENALTGNHPFAYEGHFTNDSTWDVPKRFKNSGYVINLTFFGLANTDLSEMRVTERSKEGGHYVPPLEVHANFYGNLEKLNQYFSIVDNLQIIDTSESNHIALVNIKDSKIVSSVSYNELPDWFKNFLPDIAKMVHTF